MHSSSHPAAHQSETVWISGGDSVFLRLRGRSASLRLRGRYTRRLPSSLGRSFLAPALLSPVGGAPPSARGSPAGGAPPSARGSPAGGALPSARGSPAGGAPPSARGSPAGRALPSARAPQGLHGGGTTVPDRPGWLALDESAGRARPLTLWSEPMRPSQRAGRAAVATVAAAVIGTGGVAVGAAAAGPGDTARPATAPASQPASAAWSASASPATARNAPCS